MFQTGINSPWFRVQRLGRAIFLLLVVFFTKMSFVIFLFRQQILNVAIYFLFRTLITKAEMEQDEVAFLTEENTLFYDEAFAAEMSDSTIICSQYCARHKRCKSANFVKDQKICSLLDKTRITYPELLLREQIGVTHLEKVFFIFHLILQLPFTRDSISLGNWKSLENTGMYLKFV